MKKTLQISNIVALAVTIYVNYISNTGVFNNTTIGEVSDSYRSMITPAGYTFAIWGLIYTLLIGFVVYQARSIFTEVSNDDYIEKIGWWFVASCLANSLWVVVWLYEYTGLSCFVILFLLYSILKIVMNTNMELDKLSLPRKLFTTWPFGIYAGWVTVASIVNIATYLVKIEWNAFGLSPLFWSLVILSVAVLINLWVTWQRRMRDFSFVGAWALVGIGQANQDANQFLAYVCYVGASVLILSALFNAYYVKKIQ